MGLLFALAAVGLFVFASRKGGASTSTTPGGGGPGALPKPGGGGGGGGGGGVPTKKPPIGPGLPVELPPAPIVTTTRGADNVLRATPVGLGTAIAHLLRYGPVVVELSGVGTGVPGRLASVSKRFFGTVGVPGVPPATIGETAVEWVRARLAEGSYVLVPRALLNALATADTLPELVSILAVVPDDSGNPGPQLAPAMAPDQDWVLLGDPVVLTPLAGAWTADTTVTAILTALGVGAGGG